jgi:hypothetical protein
LPVEVLLVVELPVELPPVELLPVVLPPVEPLPPELPLEAGGWQTPRTQLQLGS